MGKAQDLLEKLGGRLVEDSDKKEDEKDKDIVPINEPESEKEDDFSDLKVDDGGEKKEDEPDEFTQSVLTVMKHADDKDEDFDPEQLTAGIAVEAEHIDNKWIQKAIAKAHLAQFPNYYVALAKMEADLKAEMEKGDKKEEEPKKEEPNDGEKKEDEPKNDKEDENDV